MCGKRLLGVRVLCFNFCHQQKGSGKTELSDRAPLPATTDGGEGQAGIKVSRKTKMRFEGYARNMTGATPLQSNCY